MLQLVIIVMQTTIAVLKLLVYMNRNSLLLMDLKDASLSSLQLMVLTLDGKYLLSQIQLINRH